MNSGRRLSLIMSGFVPLAVELITHTVAFVMLLCANKGYYKHTVFWTINIKLLSIGRYLSMDFFIIKTVCTRKEVMIYMRVI